METKQIKLDWSIPRSRKDGSIKNRLFSCSVHRSATAAVSVASASECDWIWTYCLSTHFRFCCLQPAESTSFRLQLNGERAMGVGEGAGNYWSQNQLSPRVTVWSADKARANYTVIQLTFWNTSMQKKYSARDRNEKLSTDICITSLVIVYLLPSLTVL
jgi:hypothetical protein